MRATFPADLRAPAHARRFVSEQLADLVPDGGPPEDSDVLLITSELVTNAVRAGAASIDVRIRATTRSIDLEVSDDADGWPTARAAGTEDVGGRGLAIVDQLADRWKATARRRGKTVTATWFR